MHLDEGTIHAWLDGALDAEEAARLERHAAECATCAAAVAEARGLVAGASRILSALDGVPAGIVPKTTTARGASSTRRPRSLWTTLHLTPVRAAAAALVVVAAGTVLVVGVPNEARKAPATLAALPVASQPAIAMDSASPAVAAPKREARSAPRIATSPVAQSAPAPTVGRGAEARAVGVVGGAAVGKARLRSADALAVPDSTHLDRVAVSVAAASKPAEATSAIADNATRREAAGAAGAQPRAVAVPPSAANQAFEMRKASRDARSSAGCYVVTTDSALSFPRQIWLDSSARFGVSSVENGVRRPLSGAYWAPRADGSIRLTLPALTQGVELRAVAESTLAGVATVGERAVSVTLRRAECSTK